MRLKYFWARVIGYDVILISGVLWSFRRCYIYRLEVLVFRDLGGYLIFKL